MTLAVITILSLFLSAISLGVAAQRSSAPLAWAGVVLLAIGLHPIYLPWLSRLPSFQELVTTTHATNEIDALCQETKRMAKLGRSTPTKTPAVVSVERMTEPGVYDDLILVYGYSDNYAAAREIAEYAAQKYKRDYRIKTVQR